MRKFDVIVIGAGQAGVPLAKKLAKSGKKTALIEKKDVGGVCVNEGCTPTKAMIASARMAYLASRKDLGIVIKKYKINFKKVIKRKDQIVKRFREGSEIGLAKTPNLSLIYGEASFKDNHTLNITLKSNKKVSIYGELIFINTGNTPIIPQIKGIENIAYHTSDTILHINAVPKHLVILGGGNIGLEYGQMFRRFGSKVTILEHSDRLMPHEDSDVCETVSSIFKEEGIDVIVSADIIKLSNKKKSKEVTYYLNGEKKIISCSDILIATGRTPQTEQLNLGATDVKITDKGYIITDEYLKTDAAHIYALGDVKGGPAFTHISYNDYVIVSKNLLNGENLSIQNRILPYCTFIDPQLGRVGITEDEAKKQGLNYKVAKIPMENIARAIETGETRGFMKAIVDADSKQILGAAILGEEGGEIMSVLQMAMMGNITYDQIRYTIFAHPLYSESLNNLFMSLDED